MITKLQSHKSALTKSIRLFWIALFLIPLKVQAQNPQLNFRDLAWSPDGSQIAIAGSITTCSKVPSDLSKLAIYLVDSVTGQIVQSLLGATCPIESLSWSPLGDKLAGGSYEGVRIWDITTGKSTLYSFPEVENAILSIGWSKNSNTIASIAASTANILIWNVANGEISSVIGGPETSFSMAWSPDGTKIAIGTTQGKMAIWDAGTSTKLIELTGHSKTVRSVAWSPDGTRLVSGSIDNTVKVWDAISGNIVQNLNGNSSAVNSVDWSSDGNYIASGNENGDLIVWNALTGEIHNTVLGNGKSIVSVKWDPLSERIASHSYSGQIQGNESAVNIFEPPPETTPTPTSVPARIG